MSARILLQKKSHEKLFFNGSIFRDSSLWIYVKGNCSWDMFLWKNWSGLHSFM